jgi:hypothetical protein
VIEYDTKSTGAEAYRDLAAEVLRRINGMPALDELDGAEQEQPQQQPARKTWTLKALFAREDRGRRG